MIDIFLKEISVKHAQGEYNNKPLNLTFGKLFTFSPEDQAKLFEHIKKLGITAANLNHTNFTQLTPEQLQSVFKNLSDAGVTTLFLDLCQLDKLSSPQWNPLVYGLKMSHMSDLSVSNNKLDIDKIQELNAIIGNDFSIRAQAFDNRTRGNREEKNSFLTNLSIEEALSFSLFSSRQPHREENNPPNPHVAELQNKQL